MDIGAAAMHTRGGHDDVAERPMTTIERNVYASSRFSTRGLPTQMRLPALRDHFGQSIRLAIDAEPGQSVDMEVHQAPGLRRARMLSPLTARVMRPAPMLADGEDSICLMMKTAGHMALEQGRRRGVPRSGDGILLVYREPAVLQLVAASYVAVRVPFAAIATLVGDAGRAAALRISRDSQALSLLRGYVMGMPERIADPRLGRLATSHVYDLIALAIGTSDDARPIAAQRGLRAARLDALTADVIRHPALTLEELALRHGISPRYVQILFERTGTTFSLFALERRLDVARGMLASPRYASWSVTAIAVEAGFGDLSYFNRRFKRRFQTTPSALRMQCLERGQWTAAEQARGEHLEHTLRRADRGAVHRAFDDR
jgi:AraC-like DNA-binding protein